MADIVHSGYVKSKTDGDIHFVGFGQLCELYMLNPYTTIDARTFHRKTEEDKHYYPRNDGNYPAFEERND